MASRGDAADAEELGHLVLAGQLVARPLERPLGDAVDDLLGDQAGYVGRLFNLGNAERFFP